MPRILVIDDEAALRKAVRSILEREGYEVIEAADGASGLRAHRELGADLVLVDMFMPERDGLEVLRALRAAKPYPKVVAMSGGGLTGQVDVLRVAEAFGAARTLVKPFELRDLLTAIREVLAEGGPTDVTPSTR